MQTAPQEVTCGDFTATATAAVEALATNSSEDLSLGGHGSPQLDRGAAGQGFPPFCGGFR